MHGSFTIPVVCPTVVGRAPELASLRSLMEEAQGGLGQVALICGEAGIGKSRLVSEMKTYATEHGFYLLQGQCFPTDRACPYAPLVDLVRSDVPAPSTELVAEMSSLALALFPLLPDLIRPPSDLPSLPPLDAEQEQHRLFAALAKLLLRQTIQQPLLLIVEDLHWGDDASLEFLHYLARRCAGSPILLLLTYRSEDVHPALSRFLTHVNRQRLAARFTLGPLGRDDVRVMLHALLDLRRTGFAMPNSTQDGLLDALYALTEGNPYFVEEVLQALLAHRDLSCIDGTWQLKPLAEVHVPRSIQDAVQQRTGHLSDSAQRMLSLASVTGRRFDFALMQQMLGQDEQDMLEWIKELLAAQLLVEESADHFAFRHELTRQAIQAGLLARERRRLHRSVAAAIEQLYASHLDAHLADLAYHFFAAGQWENAFVYGQRAGQQAQNLYAPLTAIEHYTWALDSAEHLALPAPLAVQRARGQAYEALGDFDAARSDYEQACEAAQQLHDGANEWQSSLALGVLWAKRDYQRSGEWLQRALELAQSLADPRLQAYTLNHMGSRFTFVAEPTEALQCHRRALAIFQQVNDRKGIAETLDLLGLLHYGGGDLNEGRIYCEQAVDLLRTFDDRQGLASSLVLLMLCKGVNYHNDTLIPVEATVTESLAHGEEAFQLARATGQRSLEAYAQIYLGCCRGPHGDYAQALESLHAGVAILEEIEHHRWLVDANWILGALYLDLLAPSVAQQHLEQALTLAREVNAPGWERMVTGLLASAYVQQQDLAQAEFMLGTLRSPKTRRLGQRIAWCARAELALAQGNPTLALDIAEQLIGSAANSSSQSVIPRLSHLQGKALRLLYQTERAEAVLQAAFATALAQGAPSLQWRIAIDLGKLYHTQQRDGEAKRSFGMAQELLQELAASIPDHALQKHFLEQAIALLPHSYSPQSRAPARATRNERGLLTEREREVVRLLSQGLTNQEIAASLVVSERTINSHLVRIFRKLGVNSRTAAATYAVRHRLIE